MTPVGNSSPGLLIPLYIYPGSAWTTVIQQKEAYPSVPITVIINPDSGPGSSYSSTYGSWIVKLQDAGITVLGYVYTSYGSRSVSAVEGDISSYKQWYPVNGIFLDEMASQSGYQSYYSTLTAYAHSDGLSLVVGNPGTSVPSSYLGTVDVILVFENAYLPTASTLQTITMGQGPSNFALIAYDVSSLSSSSVALMAKYSSYIYVTNGVSPNPYSALPSYFSSLVSDVQASNPTYTISVQSETSSGSSLTGMWTVVYGSNQTIVDENYTPLVYTAAGGNSYTVCVDNYANLVFSHWQDGLTDSCRTFDLQSNVSFTAVYDVLPTGTPSTILRPSLL